MVTIGERTNERNAEGRWLYVCKCHCGNEFKASRSDISRGRKKSCGCAEVERRKQMAERNRTHGKSKHPLYARWNAMRKRCYVPSDSRYEFYGKKGVTMCKEWLENPQSFYDWYESQGGDLSLTVDRVDTYGNYTPDNCRLITLEEQQKNRRPQKDRLPDETVLKIKDLLKEKIPVPAIVKETGVDRGIIHHIKKGKTYK